MELPLAVTVGVLFGSGLYLVLQRNLLRFVFGLILMSGGVNLALFVSGRLTRGHSPFVPEGQYTPLEGVANSLPQALILTAIVISFGLTVFAMVLLLRTYERLGTVQTNEMMARLHDLHPDDGTPHNVRRPPQPAPHGLPRRTPANEVNPFEGSGSTSSEERP